MYLVAIAWIYVALMMAIAEANHANGSLLGAVVTFVLYGLLPVALLLYILGTPARKRALRERQAAEQAAFERARAASTLEPDAGGQPAGATEPGAVAAVRKEP